MAELEEVSMRLFTHIVMLAWCLWGIPQEEWYAMSDAQQDQIMMDLAGETIQELHCDEAEVEAIPDGKWMLIYGECTEDKYIAINERRLRR